MKTIQIHPNKAPIDSAMILAAGLGSRMRPITDRMPKPLIKVYGKTLLDHGLDALADAGVRRAVVNVHHLADQIEAHLADRKVPEITLSDECSQLLDSGGGIKNALPLLGEGPAYILNADSFWLEGAQPNLAAMAERWDADSMDMLLLLSCTIRAVGYGGSGDFDMDSEGRLKRRGERKISSFAYCGAAIFHPRIFEDTPDGPFSLNLLFDRAIEEGRLYGMRMDGLWLHVGTPDAIEEAEQAIAHSAA